MKRRRARESADGLALMTSSVTSSYSANGLREQSQESAGSLYIQTQERSDVVEEAIQSQATVHQQMLFGDSDSKTIKSAGTSLKRNQHVASVLPSVSYNEPAVATHPVVGKSSREFQCYCISSRHGIPDARKEEVAKRGKQTQDIQS
ncbi:syntaxin-124-like [Dorcoceras hygrometricum]|uniref:Syntaxin-124-like n=1 Tax=Dorcoceras hygrometricum TaxID=472368 RepID=A0A2Z7AW56_9LAMI|nr:syntaxin-124-like [Dorcoceras hygrometricum]